MQGVIQNIIDRLQKNNLPTEKKQNLQYFQKQFENYHSLATHIQKQAEKSHETIKKELDQHKELILQMIQKSIFFNFQDYIQEEVFARAFTKVCIAIINVDSNYVAKIFEIAQQPNKKPINKTIQLLVIKNLILQQNYMRMIAFPVLQEIFQFLLKQQKQCSEISFRIQSMELLDLLIQEKINSNYDNKKDSYKYITKYLQNEKSVILRASAAKTLQSFLKEINSGFLAGVYENLHQICFKILEESGSQNWDLRKNILKSLEILIQTFVKENIQKQIQQLKLKKSTKKDAPGQNQENEDKQNKSSDFFKDYLTNFGTHLDLYQQNKIDILEIFYNILVNNDKNLTSLFVTNICELLFNTINKNTFQNENNSCFYRDVAGKFGKKIMIFLSLQGRQDIVEYLLKKLNDYSKVMKQTYERNKQDLNNKSFLALQNQVIPALRILYELINLLGVDIYLKFPNINQLSDHIFPLYDYQNQQIWMLGGKILQSYYQVNPKYQSQQISHIFQLLSIKYAELESFKNGNEYSPEAIASASGLEGISINLQILFQNINSDLHQIPLEIAGNIFKVAKKFLKEDQEIISTQKQKLSQTTLQVFQLKGKAGWNMINSITILDAQFVKGIISEIFELWQTIIGNDRVYQSNDDFSLAEINMKRKSIKSIRDFVKLHSPLLNENYLKFLTNFVLKFSESYLTPLSKTEYRKSNDFIFAKMDLFKCLNKISPKLYSSKINNFVQSSIEDVFMLYSEDFTNSLKFYLNQEDLYISQDETDILNKSLKLFNQTSLENQSQIEKYDKYVVNYQNIFFKFQDHLTPPKQLNSLQFQYLSKILSSHYFTNKNKINLLKYLQSNLLTIINAKDFINKHIKIMPYLILGIELVKSLKDDQEKISHNNNNKEVDQEIFESLKKITQLCWSQNHEVIRTLTAYLTSQIFCLKTSQNQQQNLQNFITTTLEPGLKQRENIQTIVAIIAMLLKNITNQFQQNNQNNNNIIEQNLKSLQNILQKCSTVNNMIINKWIIFGLSNLARNCHSIENFSQIFLEIYKSVFQNLANFSLTMENPGYNNLKVQMFDNILQKNKNWLSNQQVSQIFSSNFHFQVWESLHIFAENVDENLQNNLKIQYSQIFKSEKLEEISFSKLEDSLLNVQKLNKIQLVKFLTNLKTLLIQKKMKIFQPQEIYLILQKNYNIALQKTKQNSFVNQSYDSVLETYEKVYFSDLKSIQDYVQEMQQHIFQLEFLDKNGNQNQGDEDGDEGDNKPEKKDNNNNQDKKQLQISLYNNVNISIQFKNYLAQKIYKITILLHEKLQLTENNNERAIQIRYWLNLILKLCSVNYENLKATFLKCLLILIKSFKYYLENGKILQSKKINYLSDQQNNNNNNNNNNEEDQEKCGMMISDFGAQLDAALASNLKSFELNIPEINLVIFGIVRKFFKFILKDFDQLKILLQLIVKPLENQTNLQLESSKFYSEKQMTSLHFKRIQCILKIYFFLQNLFANDASKMDQLKQFFNYKLLKILDQNLSGFILDSLIIETMSKKQIQNYENFVFISNGLKQSYNDKMLYDSLSQILQFYIKLQKNFEENYLQIQRQELSENDQTNFQENEQKKLKNKEIVNYACFQLLVYSLSSNCTFYKEELYLKKLTNKLQDLTLLNNFNQKLKILDIIILFEQNQQKKLQQQNQENNNNNQENDNNFVSLIQNQDYEFLQKILENYLDYGLFEYDLKILQIVKILAQKNSQKINQNLLNTIQMRYHQIVLEKQKSEENFQKEKQICIASLQLKFEQILSNQEIFESLSVSLFLLFKEVINYVDLNTFINVVNLLFQKQFQQQQQNNNDDDNIQQDLLNLIFGLLEENLSEIEQKGEEKSEGDLENLFKITSCLYLIQNLLENQNNNNNQNQISSQENQEILRNLLFQSEKLLQENQKIFQKFIQNLRKNFQDSNHIQYSLLPGIFSNFSQYILKIQKNFKQNNNYNMEEEESKTTQEILKFYLLIFVLSDYKSKVQQFENMFRICLLFVDKCFNNCPLNQEIFNLVQQILKKIVHSIEIPHLQKLAQQYEQKMKLVLSNILKQDPRVLQQQQQKIQQQKLEEERQQQEKSKVKLKMFAN